MMASITPHMQRDNILLICLFLTTMTALVVATTAITISWRRTTNTTVMFNLSAGAIGRLESVVSGLLGAVSVTGLGVALLGVMDGDSIVVGVVERSLVAKVLN